MREIKFRAWWKNQIRYNAIAGNGQCLFIPNGTGEYKWVNMAECNVMEFSGLKDAKGKDVYEDDLLGYWTKDVNKKDKLLLKFLENPPKKDLTFKELNTLLISLGFIKIEGAGSAVKFYNKDKDLLINLHKPHPSDILKVYLIKQIQNKLKEFL